MGDLSDRMSGEDYNPRPLLDRVIDPRRRPDRAFFNEQLLRILDSETTNGTQKMALVMHYHAREILGVNLSVFWNKVDDEIYFENERGIITVRWFNAPTPTQPDA